MSVEATETGVHDTEVAALHLVGEIGIADERG